MMCDRFMVNLNSQQDHALTFSLLAIGEVGRTTDLSQITALKPSLLSAFLLQVTLIQVHTTRYTYRLLLPTS